MEPAGWGFIALTGIIAISAFIALFGFQNKYRAKGIVGTQDTEMVRGAESPAQNDQ